jgi:hypothetical protein
MTTSRLRAFALRAWKNVPLPIRRLTWRAAGWMPPAVEDRLSAVLTGRRYAAPPPPVDVPRAPVRLYIAPLNAAGQAYAWARAAETLEGVGARNMAAGSPFGAPSDYDVPGFVYRSRVWQRGQRNAVRRFTHAIIEAQLPYFPRSSSSFLEEAEWLRRAGLAVATLCHGTDIRRPADHAARDPWSPFRDGVYPGIERVELSTARNLAGLEALRERGVPAFVSTPDLVLDVPWATWLPVAVDAEAWRTESAPLTRDVPVVVHAPSRASLKGTDLIEPVVRELQREGRVEYRQATGLDHAAMRSLYREADIVIDQLRLGIYGVAACEAMAAGRVVVSHVGEQSRAAARTAAQQDLPVVEATGDTLREVLTALTGDRERARATAARGPRFVSTLHDGRASARALRPFLLGGPPTR